MVERPNAGLKQSFMCALNFRRAQNQIA